MNAAKTGRKRDIERPIAPVRDRAQINVKVVAMSPAQTPGEGLRDVGSRKRSLEFIGSYQDAASGIAML
jgi:hypothetical protein